MKKHRFYVLTALAALFGFSACSTDDVATDSQPVGNKVIVKAGIGEGSIFTRSNPTSMDEAEQGKFNANDQINISDGNKSVNYTTTDGTTWNPTNSGEFLTWHSDNVTFKAFYPVANIKVYDDFYDNTFEVGHVMTDQSSIENINASDFMTATATKDKEPSDHTLGLQFERKTARVVVNVVGHKNQFDELGIVRADVNGITKSGDSNVKWITSYMTDEDKQFVALVFPTEARPAETFLRFNFTTSKEVGGARRNVLTYTGIPKLDAGKSYTFNVTLGSDKVTLESVTVEDWATGDPIGKGEATEFEAKVDLTNMTANDLTTWLETNASSIKGSTISLTGAWNDNFYEPLRNALRNEENKVTLDMSNVTNITEINVPDVSNIKEENGFSNTKDLNGIILPPGVTKIGDFAFNSTRITNIDLKNVEEIGSSAFISTPIHNITIPKKITNVTALMLESMSNLKDVTFDGDIKEFQHSVFYDDYALETIDLSNCKSVPKIEVLNWETFIKIKPENITVIVGSEAMKNAFENDERWKSVGFKDFQVK